MEKEKKNPLGEEKVSRLLAQFAVPSIVAMLVSSLYNIVDQFFIGRSVGELGNAATNIAFPLSITCIAIALFFGIGGAANFNIAMGRKQKEEAVSFFGNSITMLLLCGLLLCVVTEIFLDPMLHFFGSPDDVLEYARTYTRITALGFPFLILATGGGHLIRADGRPKIAMLCNLTGAVVNTALDALFVFGFQWGMAGAAAATVTGQAFSAGVAAWFLMHAQSIRLKKEHLMIQPDCIKRIASLGIAPAANQIAMMIVQIVMNKSLKYYGSLSVYGEATPIACVGIITKINQVFMSFVIGLSQGMQPIVSYNYGLGQFGRMKRAYRETITVGALFSIAAFLVFFFAPRQIIGIFGNGSEEYFGFAIKYFKIFLFFTFLNFMQPITSNFYTGIGKAVSGMFLALTRQIIFLLPLLLILPVFVGIDGIMYAGPVADFMAALVSFLMVARELGKKTYREEPLVDNTL